MRGYTAPTSSPPDRDLGQVGVIDTGRTNMRDVAMAALVGADV